MTTYSSREIAAIMTAIPTFITITDRCQRRIRLSPREAELFRWTSGIRRRGCNELQGSIRAWDILQPYLNHRKAFKVINAQAKKFTVHPYKFHVALWELYRMTTFYGLKPLYSKIKAWIDRRGAFLHVIQPKDYDVPELGPLVVHIPKKITDTLEHINNSEGKDAIFIDVRARFSHVLAFVRYVKGAHDTALYDREELEGMSKLAKGLRMVKLSQELYERSIA